MTVVIERHGDKRIIAKIPYACGLGPLQAKEIPGARPLYEKREGSRDRFIGWTYALDLAVCRKFRHVFGDELVIGPDLSEWAWAERGREKELEALRAGQGAMLERVPAAAPKLWAAIQPRPYQVAGAAFAARSGAVLVADEAGSGKTLQALAALVEAGARRVLVFAKRTALRTVWQREAERWLGGGVAVWLARGTHRQREEILESYNSSDADLLRLLICNIEMMRVKRGLEVKETSATTVFIPDWPQLFAQPWDAIVLDESHRALVGKSHYSTKITQTRLGAVQLPLADGGLKIALSATPYRGKLLNTWGTLNWLRPDVFTSYWRYVETYWKVDTSGYGGARVIGDLRPEMEDELDRTLAPYVLRRTKAEIFPQLPPKQYAGTPLDPDDEGSPVGVWLDMPPEQERAYRDMATMAQAELGEETLLASSALAQRTRLKQFATSAGRLDDDGRFRPALPSAKLDWLLEHLEECEGKHVVVSQFTQVIEMFAESLRAAGHESFQITGNVKDDDRDRAVRQFQGAQDEIRIMLLNTRAGGESITLDQADHLIFLDETEVPDEQEQAEDRVHRTSRVHQVTIYYLRSAGTIEEDIVRLTMARETEVKERLDGSRGVAYNRRVLHKSA
jgi:SNF2 family DNA or RNA helicase